MNLVEIASSKFKVMAVMDGNTCPAIDFLVSGEATTQSSRSGLLVMIETVAENGLDGVPPTWLHEASKQHGIYEFIKGRLRLFFFKGANGQIAVCSGGVLKKTGKADKSAVSKAAEFKARYFADMAANNIKVIAYGTEP